MKVFRPLFLAAWAVAAIFVVSAYAVPHLYLEPMPVTSLDLFVLLAVIVTALSVAAVAIGLFAGSTSRRHASPWLISNPATAPPA